MNTNRLERLRGSAERVVRGLLERTDVRVLVGGHAASYNGKTHTMMLPGFNAEPDDPKIMSAWRGVLDHECSHALHSDFDAGEIATKRWEAQYGQEGATRIHHLWNVFEDVYIERRMMEKFPGSRTNITAQRQFGFEKTGGARATDPGYAPNGRPIGEFEALTQTILRIGLELLNEAEVHPDTLPLIDIVRPAMEQGFKAASSVGCLEAAEQVWRLLQQAKQDQPQQPQGGEDEKPEDSEQDEQEQQPQDGGGSADGSEEPEEGDESAESGESGQGKDSPGDGQEESGGAEGGDAPESGSEGSSGRQEPASRNQPETGGTDPGERVPPGQIRFDEEDHGGSDAPAKAPGGGVGRTGHAEYEKVASAVGGDFMPLPSFSDVVNAEAVKSAGQVYVVHPGAKAIDEVTRYNAQDRARAKSGFERLEKSAGTHGRKLASYFEGVFAASRQSVWVGNMEEGEALDEDALPGLVTGTNGSRVFKEQFRGIEENSFVCVLVDCSGSMGDSAPYQVEGRWVVNSKAGYAAATATTLHYALRACRVPHTVLGYTTGAGTGISASQREYARFSTGRHDFVFVEAPGLDDRGEALSYITGNASNMDGESVLWAAEYAAKHGADADRIILLVVSDGLPSGADNSSLDRPYLTEVVQQVAGAGIEVYGIGVCISDKRRFEEFYPNRLAGAGKAATGHVLLDSEKGLTDTVLRGLTGLITRGYGTNRKGTLA